MQSSMAVDVALLPPAAIASAAIALSAMLPEAESQGLRLDDDHLPHITLTQQFVPRGAIEQVADAIGRALNGRRAVPLSVTGPGRGSQSVWMRIGVTPDLQELHRALMDALQPFEQRSAGANAFAGGDARPGDITWVSGFRRNASFEQFIPHMTLGHAGGLPHVEPVSFDATTVALCHLGRFCTCREVLRSWTLVSHTEEDSSR